MRAIHLIQASIHLLVIIILGVKQVKFQGRGVDFVIVKALEPHSQSSGASFT